MFESASQNGDTLNDIPILTFDEPMKVVELKENIIAPTYPHDPNTQRQHGISLHGVTIVPLNFSVYDSECKGNLCDSLSDTCACLAHTSVVSTVVFTIDFLVTPQTKDGEKFKIQGFSSKTFTAFCMKEKKMPIALHASMILASRKGRIDIFRAMQAILKTVNENGGWSLTAWSKQGKIKDEAQKKDVNIRKPDEIHSTKITVHMTSLNPTRKGIDDCLEHDRFDISSMIH